MIDPSERPPSARRGLLWFAIAALGIVALAFGFHERAPSPTPPAATAPATKRDLALERAAVGAAHLRDSMRNPGRFQLAQVLAMDNGTICYLFRGENGAGGVNVETALLDGLTLKGEQSPGFMAEWNHACVGNSRQITAATAALMAAIGR